MVAHMKTTMDLPDELMREVKARAMADGVPMRDLMIEGLRNELERREERPKVDFVFPVSDGGGRMAEGMTMAEAIELSYGDRL
jgi:ferredoxin-NADP reductase